MKFREKVTLDDILSGCKQSNPKSQRQLYDLYARRMTAVCLRYCNDYESARDLMHEGFIRLFDHIADFKSTGPFEAWMQRIFINLSLEFIRKNDLLKESIDIDAVAYSLPNNDEPSVDGITAEEIMGAVAKLPDCARTIFNLYAIDGYNLAEIAEMLNMSETAVRSQHSRAKQKLRVMVQKIIDEN